MKLVFENFVQDDQAIAREYDADLRADTGSASRRLSMVASENTTPQPT